MEIDVWGHGHVLGLDPKNLEASVLVGDGHLELPIEASRSAQGHLDGVGAVGSADDDNVRGRLEGVHEGEELGHDALLGLALRLITLGGDGVELVHEYDGGGLGLRLLEGLP